MKWRNRKKAFECAHLHHEHDWMTDDPYDMYWDYDWCGVNRFGLGTKESPDENDPCWNKHHPCESCKKFKLSKAMIRKEREIQKEIKEIERLDKKIAKCFPGKTDDEIFSLTYDIDDLLSYIRAGNKTIDSPYYDGKKHLLDDYPEYCKLANKYKINW